MYQQAGLRFEKCNHILCNLYFIVNCLSQLCEQFGSAACIQPLQDAAEFLQNNFLFNSHGESSHLSGQLVILKNEHISLYK